MPTDTIPCQACGKTYADMETHLERQPLCKRWVVIAKNVPHIVEAITRLDAEGAFTKKESVEDALCKSCDKTYTTRGNLNKHVKRSPVCRKFYAYAVDG